MNTLSEHKLVALGGGTGLPLVLKAACSLGIRPSAVVTMADDGGSSGRLRRELGIVPPGDVRKCVTALANPEKSQLASIMSYRFSEGEGIAGHALGNLMLAACSDIEGSFEEALKCWESLLDTQGRVLPSTFEPVSLHGFDRSGEEVYGQVSLTCNPVAIVDVKLQPSQACANPEAVAAILEADTIIVCPGSLFTSIIPNLLIPGILDAIKKSPAQVFFCCNVANMEGETAAFTPLDYVAALEQHGLEGRIDHILLPKSMATDTDKQRLGQRGIKVTIAELGSKNDPARHDQDALARELQLLLDDRRGDARVNRSCISGGSESR